MSIVPPDPDSKTKRHEPSLMGVGQMMQGSADPFTVQVGLLIEYIGHQHQPPVCCDECRGDDRDPSYPCLMQESATGAAIPWLMDRANEAH